LATKACTTFVAGAYEPTALQLPGDPHETCETDASPDVFNEESPGTSIAVPQVPLAPAITGTTCAITHIIEASTTAVANRWIGRRRLLGEVRIVRFAARTTKRTSIRPEK